MGMLMLMKSLNVAAVFCAYPISQSLPLAVFLFSIKSRWVSVILLHSEGVGEGRERERGREGGKIGGREGRWESEGRVDEREK